MKKIFAYSFFVFLLIAFIFLAFLHLHKKKRPAYPITKQVQYSFTVQNTTNKSLANAELWTYAPVKQTATQLCKDIETSYPYQLTEDEWGNQILYFKFKNLPPYATKLIQIKASLKLSDRPNDIQANQIESFLQSSPYIESDHLEIQKKAESFKASNVVETVNRIFKWVTHHITYTGYLKNDRGALYALKHKKGDCTEYMYLFTAMCRANKIPARGIGGYICKESTKLKPRDFHNWSEFYHNDTWGIADPQNDTLMKNSANYIAMRIIHDAPQKNHPQFNKFYFRGKGLKVTMDS
ncbi:MAG: transglutaminase-like domain-containing protein [Pseudomonadota bacterium]